MNAIRSLEVAPGVRGVFRKRDHRSGFRIAYLVAERAARCAFQHEQVFVLILMDMQRRAVARLRDDLDERIDAVCIGRRHADQATFTRPRLQPVSPLIAILARI